MLRKIGIFLGFTLSFWFALNGQTGEKVYVDFTNIGPYAQAGSTQSAFFLINNFTAQEIAQIAIFWKTTNSEPIGNQTINITIEPWSKRLVELPNQFAIGPPGQYSMSFWIGEVNGLTQPQPDTLKIHFQSLQQTAGRGILFENFSSIGCGTCAGANTMLRLLSNKYKKESFFVAYQTDCYAGNPMCHMASADILERKDYYNVLYTPFSVLGNYFSDNSYTFQSTYFDSELQRPSPISIDGAFSTSGTTVTGLFTLTPHTQIAIENLIARVAITQDVVTFDTPPGSNGEKVFYHVLRRFVKIPKNQLEPLARGEDITFNFTENFSGFNVDFSLLKLAVFVQDTSTRDVIQAFELQNSSTSVSPSFSDSKINVYPNPSGLHLDVSLELPLILSKPHKVLVRSMLGQLLWEKEMAPGSSVTQISTGMLSKGLYVITVNGAEVNGSQKLIVN